MSSLFRVAGAVALLAATTIVVRAQPASGAFIATAPGSSASAASASALGYRSAFEGYRAFSDQPVGSWRQANDLVAKIGGWQAYAREGQGGSPAGSASAPAAKDAKAMSSMPGMQGHAVHDKAVP